MHNMLVIYICIYRHVLLLLYSLSLSFSLSLSLSVCICITRILSEDIWPADIQGYAHNVIPHKCAAYRYTRLVHDALLA